MRSFVLLPLLAGACTWVSNSQVECQLKLVDDDSDGFPANQVEAGFEDSPEWCDHLVPVDCNDGDELIYPDAAETWYDGIDGDCAVDDDYDQDLDGYVADVYEGLPTQGVEHSGEIPGGDCDDTLADVNPAAPDTAYDGTDSNCNGNDDYDLDQDGYVPDAWVGFTTRYVDGSGALPGGDCDDTQGDVNPVAEDPWYDGRDTDCDGRDDYDQDGDGFVTDAYAGLATTYVDGSGRLPAGDCDDEDGTISPTAVDAWYDGIDSDCAGDDDYDQDGDTYRDALAGGADCLDTDATVYPGAREELADPVDQDCDGGADSFVLSDVAGFTWQDVKGLSFAQEGDTVYLGVPAGRFVYGDTYYDSAAALVFDAEDLGSGLVNAPIWLAFGSDAAGTSLSPGTRLVTDAEAFYGVLGRNTTSGRELLVRRYEEATPPVYSNASADVGGTDVTFEDVALAWDTVGGLHAVGCVESADPDAFVYVWVDPVAMVGTNQYNFATGLAYSGSPCDIDFLQPDGSATIWLSRSGTGGRELVAYNFTPCTDPDDCFLTEADIVEMLVISDYQPVDMEILLGSDGERLVVLADGITRNVILLSVDASFVYSEVARIDVDPSDQAIDLSVAQAPDGTIYVGYVTDGGVLGLAYGRLPVPGTFTLATFALDFVPTDVAVTIADNGVPADGYPVLLAASGAPPASTDDRVVWGLGLVP